MEELEVAQYAVTCLTAKCENGNIEITMTAPKENPSFVCGVCFQKISSVKKAK
jgi:hypothetical protein